MPSHWQYISYFLYILTYLLHMRSRRGSSGGQVRNILAAKPPRVVERSHEALDKRIRRFVEFRGGRSHHEIFRDPVRVHPLTEGPIFKVASQRGKRNHTPTLRITNTHKQHIQRGTVHNMTS